MKKTRIHKLLKNKIFLFIIPNLIYFSFFCYFYNIAYNRLGDAFEILYREIFILSLIYFIVFSFVHFLLRIIFSDIKTFFIKIILILLIFNFVYNSIYFILILFFFLVFIFMIDESKREKLVFIVSSAIIIILILNFFPATKNCIYSLMRINSKDVQSNIVVSNKKDVPNIYWIHCDAMLNFDDTFNYFEFDSKYIREYLDENDFLVNSSASLESAHHTMQALVALYNPNYYDNFFNSYLSSMHLAFDGIIDEPDYIVSYDDLLNKRINNELFSALKKKGYKLATITDFNQYASFYSDYIYDFYTFQYDDSKELRFSSKEKNSYDRVINYIKYSHLKTLGDTTILHKLTDNLNFLDYEVLDYNDFDYSEYKYVNESEYYKSKAIIKSLDHLYKFSNKNIFTFIDFSIVHVPWLYDVKGNTIPLNQIFYLDSFVRTYEHATYLLVDILEYIKSKDKDSVIVIQGDHGIHTLSSFYIKNYINGSNSDLKKIRNSTISAIYIPEEYVTGDEKYLTNPLNISRYLINNYVGNNYEYLND